MNEEIKRQWVEALRSGEYQQTESRLKGIKGFCCLGVLCDLYAKEHNIPWNENTDPDTGRLQYGLFNENKTLPNEVQKWAGIKTSSPEVKVNLLELEPDLYKLEPDLYELVTLNDDYGYNFDDLADLIEAQL